METLAEVMLGFPLLESSRSKSVQCSQGTDYGWKLNGDTLEIDWDSKENMEQIRDRVKHLLKGCGCKTRCNNKRCSCVKDGRHCGPGCSCCNCENTQYMTISSEMDVEEEEVQEDNIVREDYRQLEEEDFSDTEEQDEQDEHTSDREQEEDEAQ